MDLKFTFTTCSFTWPPLSISLNLMLSGVDCWIPRRASYFQGIGGKYSWASFLVKLMVPFTLSKYLFSTGSISYVRVPLLVLLETDRPMQLLISPYFFILSTLVL